MAIRGSLKEASLPDVLQLLAMGKKSGCLSVTHRNNFGSIFFDGEDLLRLDREPARPARRHPREERTPSRSRHSTRPSRCRRARPTSGLGELLVEKHDDHAREPPRSRSASRSRRPSTSCSRGRRGRSTSSPTSGRRSRTSSSRSTRSRCCSRERVAWTSGASSRRRSRRSTSSSSSTGAASSRATSRSPRAADLLASADRRPPRRRGDRGRVGARGVRGGEGALRTRDRGLPAPRGRSPPQEPRRRTRIEEHRNLGVAFYKTGMLDEARARVPARGRTAAGR